MKRWATLLSAMIMFCGCSQDEQAKPAPKAAAVTTAKPAEAKAAASKSYYEMNKDGRTYVFGNIPSMQRISRGEQVANLVVKEGYGPNGETVAFESDGAGLETRLMEDYTKQHPKK